MLPTMYGVVGAQNGAGKNVSGVILKNDLVPKSICVPTGRTAFAMPPARTTIGVPNTAEAPNTSPFMVNDCPLASEVSNCTGDELSSSGELSSSNIPKYSHP